jgi:hypothetical protein
VPPAARLLALPSSTSALPPSPAPPASQSGQAQAAARMHRAAAAGAAGSRVVGCGCSCRLAKVAPMKAPASAGHHRGRAAAAACVVRGAGNAAGALRGQRRAPAGGEAARALQPRGQVQGLRGRGRLSRLAARPCLFCQQQRRVGGTLPNIECGRQQPPDPVCSGPCLHTGECGERAQQCAACWSGVRQGPRVQAAGQCLLTECIRLCPLAMPAGGTAVCGPQHAGAARHCQPAHHTRRLPHPPGGHTRLHYARQPARTTHRLAR